MSKIVHVVAYVAPDGSYGGPTRVASNQARALARRGHSVTLMASAPIRKKTVEQIDGVTVRLYPALFLAGRTRFAFLTSWQLVIAASRMRPDITHFHLARDLITLPSAILALVRRMPYVTQTHGMVASSTRPLAAFLDWLATRRVLLGASKVLCLTEDEEREIQSVAPTADKSRLTNGVEVRGLPSYEGRKKRVIFLSRLQERKRPLAFVAMAAKLSTRWPEIEFVLYGPDGGEGPAVEAACREQATDRVRWEGPVAPENTEAVLTDALAFVLPSYGEVFPMAILEAFQAGTPVVTTDSLGIADECRSYGSAIVTNGDIDGLADAVEAILRSTEKAAELRTAALRHLLAKMSVDKVAGFLEHIYIDAINSNGSSRS